MQFTETQLTILKMRPILGANACIEDDDAYTMCVCMAEKKPFFVLSDGYDVEVISTLPSDKVLAKSYVDVMRAKIRTRKCLLFNGRKFITIGEHENFHLVYNALGLNTPEVRKKHQSAADRRMKWEQHHYDRECARNARFNEQSTAIRRHKVAKAHEDAAGDHRTGNGTYIRENRFSNSRAIVVTYKRKV